jgi:AraC family transcriptional regulator
MTAHALPKSCACLTPLYAGDLFAISNWRCGGDDSPGREEELCDADRIVVTRRGSFELTVRGVAHFVDPLVATFWNRGEYFRVRHPVSAIDECTVFRLTERGTNTLQEFIGRTSARSMPYTFKQSARVVRGSVFLQHRASLTAVRNRHTIDALDVEERTLAFLRSAVDAERIGASTGSNRQDRSRVVDRAREIVSSAFMQPLSVTRIAQESNCSPFHLSRLFRSATGMTLHRAVVQLRLREGLERLLDAPEQVSSIALDVGFASHSHFTGAFRAEYGCAPCEARLLLRQR